MTLQTKHYRGTGMTREEFKTRWESDDNGDGITFDDIANCAVEWGLYNKPKISPIDRVRYRVLLAAGTVDAKEFNPDEQEDRDE